MLSKTQRLLPDESLVLFERVVHVPDVLLRVGTQILDVLHGVEGVPVRVDELLGTAVQERLSGLVGLFFRRLVSGSVVIGCV